MRIHGTRGHSGTPHTVTAGPRVTDTRTSIFDTLPHPPEWMQEGLCAQADPELWHPEKGGSTREAKKICLSCPVQSQCLDYAMSRNERYGIWGGLSERKRRQLKQDLRWAS